MSASKDIRDYVISGNDSIKDAVQVIQQNSSRCAIVENKEGKVIGIFSEGDVLRSLLNETNLYTPLRSVITPQFLYMHAYDADEAFGIFKKYGVSLIPIVDADFKLTDVITLLDFLTLLSIDKE